MIRKTDPQAVAPYLKDASNYSGGAAEEVVLPESTGELVEYLRSSDQPVTVAGAGTGVTASRIPPSGVIISLERLKGIGELQDGTVEVGPAVTLQELEDHLRPTPYFYPPNPTETLASLGGTLATNASGSRSYKYGVTRDYVLEAEIVLADGRCARLTRDPTIDKPLRFPDGSEIHFPEVKYTSPRCKNAAGYYVQPDMSWLDLFIGSDGTLCIFNRIRLKLLPRPADFISGVLFFREEEACWRLVEKIRSLENGILSPCSLEYFDFFSLQRLKTQYPTLPEPARAALFFEQDVPRKEDYESIQDAWFDFLSDEDELLDDSWFAQTLKDVQKFHEFRHQIPVLLNEENSRLGRVKIGTDMAVPDSHFMDLMRYYQETLSGSGMDYVIFGHLGDNHLHVNLLPDPEEIERAQELHHTMVQQVLKWQGTVSAEHGIGKLKKGFFAEMVGPEALDDLRRIKKAFDPQNRLGRGNIL